MLPQEAPHYMSHMLVIVYQLPTLGGGEPGPLAEFTQEAMRRGPELVDADDLQSIVDGIAAKADTALKVAERASHASWKKWAAQAIAGGAGQAHQFAQERPVLETVTYVPDAQPHVLADRELQKYLGHAPAGAARRTRGTGLPCPR